MAGHVHPGAAADGSVLVPGDAIARIGANGGVADTRRVVPRELPDRRVVVAGDILPGLATDRDIRSAGYQWLTSGIQTDSDACDVTNGDILTPAGTRRIVSGAGTDRHAICARRLRIEPDISASYRAACRTRGWSLCANATDGDAVVTQRPSVIPHCTAADTAGDNATADGVSIASTGGSAIPDCVGAASAGGGTRADRNRVCAEPLGNHGLKLGKVGRTHAGGGDTGENTIALTAIGHGTGVGLSHRSSRTAVNPCIGHADGALAIGHGIVANVCSGLGHRGNALRQRIRSATECHRHRNAADAQCPDPARTAESDTHRRLPQSCHDPAPDAAMQPLGSQIDRGHHTDVLGGNLLARYKIHRRHRSIP